MTHTVWYPVVTDRDEAEDVESVVDGHQDDVAKRGEHPSVVERLNGRTDDESTPVNPNLAQREKESNCITFGTFYRQLLETVKWS